MSTKAKDPKATAKAKKRAASSVREALREQSTDPWMKALKYRENKDGTITYASVLSNAITILANDPRWKDVIAWDEFSSQYVATKAPPWSRDDEPAADDFRAGPWSDTDTTRLQAWFLRSEFAINIGSSTVYAALDVVARRRVIHPVRDFLDNLEWDERPRLDSWLKRGRR